MDVDLCRSNYTPRAHFDFKCIYGIKHSSFENILQVANCLQYTLLVWIPFVFTLWAAVMHLFLRFFRSKKLRNRCTNLSIAKVVIAFLVCLVLVIRCILDAQSRSDSLLSVPPILLVITTVTLLAMILYDHRNGVSTSGLIFTGWLILVLTGSVQFFLLLFNAFAKTGSCIIADDVCYTIFYVLAIIELILQTWVDKKSYANAYDFETKLGPTDSVSFFNRLFFGFFWKLAITGWKKPLKFDDLWQLSKNDRTAYVHEKWMNVWSKGSERYNPEKNIYFQTKKQLNEHPVRVRFRSIFMTSLICFKWLLIPAIFLNAAAILLQFVGPQVLKYLLGFMQNHDQPLMLGVAVTFFMFFCDTLQTICQQQHMYLMFMISFRLKSALLSTIYAKILKLSTTDNKDNSGKIISYVTSDVQRILNTISRFQMVWTSPTQTKLMNRKDARVGALSELINCIKVIKLNSWEAVFSRRIGAKRSDELRVYHSTNVVQACQDFTMCIAPLAVSALSFAVFTLIDPEKNLLTPQVAFVSLSLFNILRQPLNDFPALISGLLQANISRKRIESFFACTEIDKDAVQRKHVELADGDVRFVNGWFQHTSRKDPDFSLKRLNLHLRSGQLIAVVGPVGAGKTTFLSAILGELIKTDGVVTVKGEVAYVPQEAWITNATVRNNVTFSKPYDQSYYNQVVKACALTSDFQSLPNGDGTEIGEKGANLSGGQKQRISLARAVYQNRDIYLLDDPLAAVDVHVGKHIFTQVISNDGILKNKTRIFVTHNVRYMQFADYIVVLNEGGVSTAGTYAELNREGIFEYLLDMENVKEKEEEEASATSLHGSAENVEIKSPNGITEKFQISDHPPLDEVRIEVNGFSVDSEECETNVDKPAEICEKTTFLPPGGKNEKIGVGKVPWTVYKKFLKALGYWPCIGVLICFVSSFSFGLSSNFWLAKWTDDVTSNNTAVSLTQRLSVYGILGIMEGAFVLTAALFVAHAMRNASTLLHSKMLHSVLRSPMRFFDTTPAGVIITRFSSDCDQTDWSLPFCLQQWAYGMLKIVSILVVIVVGSPLFAIAILPLAIFYHMIQKFFISTARQIKRLMSANNSPVISMFSTTYQGVSCLRAYGAQKFFTTECHNRIDRSQIAWYPNIVSVRWLALYLQFFGNCIVLLAALFAVLMRGNSTESGLLGLAITSTLTITYSMIAAVRSMSEVETSIVAAERVQEYTELESEGPWETGYKVADNWPSRGCVQFEDYSTRHRADLDLALRHVSCTIGAASKVGVVGRTGAGKSTLSLALLRAIEPSGGRILIDGVDIALLGLRVLRSRVAIIPQEPVLFSGSIRFNLDPLGEYSDDQLFLVLDQANQRAFINSLSDKLDFVVEQSGSNLSVGQRQLLCLARALLKNSRIMVLDEATAAVDIDTEQTIQKALQNSAQDKTVITIAHRLTTVLDADLVMVMSDGKLIEFDSPKKLMNDQSSSFGAMVREAGLFNSQ